MDYEQNLIGADRVKQRLKSICSNQILFNRNLKQLKESFLWSGYPNYIIENCFKITIKQKPQNLLNSVLDVLKIKFILVFSILMKLR